MTVTRPVLAFLLVVGISATAALYGLRDAALYMVLLLGGIALYKFLR